eukprot:6497682-Prymnesium_polylepis.1
MTASSDQGYGKPLSDGVIANASSRSSTATASSASATDSGTQRRAHVSRPSIFSVMRTAPAISCQKRDGST